MRYWTSDPHFFHERIIGFCDRPFSNTDHMHEELVRRYNERVGDDDECVFLGDITFGNVENLKIVNRLRGRKVLIAGNHDKIFSGESQSRRDRFYSAYDEAFDLIVSLSEDVNVVFKELPGVRVRACHFPPIVGAYDGRFAKYHPTPEDGTWYLHGHTHSPVALRPELRMIHVGVDAWNFYPVSDDEIVALIKEHSDVD